MVDHRSSIINKDCAQLVLDFEEKFVFAVPVRQYLWKFNEKFEYTGCVCNVPKCSRTRTAKAEHNLQVIAQSFVEKSSQSQRKASLELDISRSSLQ